MSYGVALAVAALALVLMAAPLVALRAPPADGPAPIAVGPLITDAVAAPIGVRSVPVPADQPLQLTFALANPRSGALDAYLAAIEDPRSPEYRHYLTHADFLAEFAPTAVAAGSVSAALASDGAEHVSIAPDRLSVSATLTASEADSALGITLVEWEAAGGVPEYTARGTPDLSAPLRGAVSSIDGLSNAPGLRLQSELETGPPAPVPRSAGPDAFAVVNGTPQQWFVGSDFTNTLGAIDLLPNGSASIPNATFPTGVSIATLLASGYNETAGGNTPPWDPSVVRAYFNDTLAPAWVNVSRAAPLVGIPVSIGGITPPAPGPFGGVQDSTLDNYENSLDLEMAGSLAPGAGLYNFYFGGSLIAGSASDGDVAGYFDQDLAAALAYDYGSSPLGVVSCSFGIADLNDSVWNSELQEAAAMGVTVVAASGDQGNAPNQLTGRDDGQWPIWPASAAFNTSGAVSVGGVTIRLGGNGAGWYNGSVLQIGYDANSTGLTGVATWWDTLGGAGSYAGSEGGVSTVYPQPTWQFHSAAQPEIVNATILQGASALGRSGPDVAYPANTTVAFVYANPQQQLFYSLLEGTSIAAPSFAGLLADEIAVAHHDFGFIDPELYRLGSYFQANPGSSSAYLDVTTGGNYVFAAEPGWDATTGWGVPLAVEWYTADANATIRDYVYTGPTPGLPPPTASSTSPGISWSELALVFGIGLTVAVVLVILVARPGGPKAEPPPPPFGAAMMGPPAAGAPTVAGPPPASTASGATFLCPYCGAVRPAEPIRCPKCGAI